MQREYVHLEMALDITFDGQHHLIYSYKYQVLLVLTFMDHSEPCTSALQALQGESG